jgi:tripartite motif-containing protein 2/3
MNLSSTLVETVSIDYEDFNESFLTCGTCLNTFDAGLQTPKLLPCSHTICLECLTRIVATFARDSQFRCPICRELITIPAGGVVALPPSFLVNQLLDLMARQRKEVVPKCSSHPNQELLFCETCDTVFCSLCTLDGGHSQGTTGPGSTGPQDHTVIPFSIAIKRMSEILLYKAKECTSKLDTAHETVTREMHRLDHRGDAAYDEVRDLFDTVVEAVERRREEVLLEVKRKKDEKRRVLEEQLRIIQAEKAEVDSDMERMQHQIEVRNITKKISELNTKLDAVNQLSEPRENSFMEFSRQPETSYPDEVRTVLRHVGTIKTSKTFPSLCRASLDTVICSLEALARVQTIDYNGSAQELGGDPITVTVMDQEERPVEVAVEDKEDGTYLLRFTPPAPGTYCLRIHIFDRPIRDCPLYFDVTEHNSPLLSFGSRGVADAGFVQPCSLAVGPRDQLYVVDTGNSRIKVLSGQLDFQAHMFNESLEGRSVTGVCLGASGDSLVTVNWRTKTVTEMDLEGRTIGGFSHDDLVEPIALAVTQDDEVLIADNGVGAVLLFESSGKLKRRIGSRGKGAGQFKELGGVCVGPGGEVLVADTRILVFSAAGEFLRALGGGRGGRYCGVQVEGDRVLAARTEKGRAVVQVLSLASGELLSTIDSHGARLQRPTGLAVSRQAPGAVFVVDIGHDCVRKYRYK